MDSGLILKRKLAVGEKVTNPMAYLDKSEIVKKYSNLTHLTDLGKIFAFVGLSEIPFAEELSITKELICFINERIATEKGFSYTGQVKDIVPCYNAMLLEAYCRLGLGETTEAENARDWIKKYQLFDRGATSDWKESGVCKFGGCFKNTPCYIGVGKSVRALVTYQKLVNKADEEVADCLIKGVDYMLRHQLFKRLSNDRPISPHITENMFPQSYVLSVTDLVYIAGEMDLWKMPETNALKDLIQSKRTKNGGWKIDYIYKYNGYLPFDNRRTESVWLTDFYRGLLKESQSYEK